MSDKLHIGNGAVYLDGWINIDLPGPRTFLASQRPDLVKRWKTTDDRYYGRHRDKTVDTLRAGPLNQETVCDAFGSLDNIPASYWSASQVLIRHVFEHLSIKEAHTALDQIDAIMEPNGILRIDVPDHEETLRLYRETGDPFYVRHLLGPRTTEQGYHLCGYTRDILRDLVEKHGFICEGEEPNIHLYPSMCLRFVKPGTRAPRDYIQLPPIPADWKVVDIGPGAYPLPRANVYIDKSMEILRPIAHTGKEIFVGELESGLEKIPTHAFDYAFCSHVMEHVGDPCRVAAMISRIAKRGTVVLPSAMKEGLFAHEETDHKWLILPNPSSGGPPIFVKHNPEYIAKLRDTEMQKIMCRMFRTGPNRNGEEQRYLRQWFYKNESALDIVIHWENRFEVQVIA